MSTAITPRGGGSANQTDYSAFGAVEWRPLSCIQAYVSAAMVRSWTTIPHVAHFEEADLTGVDSARVA